MIVSDKDLEEFKRIYKESFNEDISNEDAIREAINLIEILRLFSKPVSKEDFLALHFRLIERWKEKEQIRINENKLKEQQVEEKDLS